MRRRLQACCEQALPQGPLDALRQLGLFIVAYLGYETVRGLVGTTGTRPFSDATRIIDLERTLHVFAEPEIQSWTTAHAHWLLDIAEDWARSYDIDGIMWGSERQGAFSNALGASHAHPQPAQATCFCEFCYTKARTRGVNPERAKAGFLEHNRSSTSCPNIPRILFLPFAAKSLALWALLF